MSSFSRCVYPNCSVLRPLGSMFLVCDAHAEKVEIGIECVLDFGRATFVAKTDERYARMSRGLTRPAVRFHGYVYTVAELHRSPAGWEQFYKDHPELKDTLIAQIPLNDH